MTAQLKCILGGYTFLLNGVTQSKVQPISAQFQPTLGGGFISSYGVLIEDMVQVLEFPVLRSVQYTQLETLKNSGIAQEYTDWTGTAYHVFVMSLEHSSQLQGSQDAWVGVKMQLRVLSQP